MYLTSSEDEDGESGVDVTVVLTNSAGLLPGEGGGLTRVRDPSATRLPEPLRVPSAFDDDPKYLTLGELRAVAAEPRRSRAVDRRAHALEHLIARQRLINELSLRVRGGLSVVLDRRDMTFRISASEIAISEDAITLSGEGGGPVRIEHELDSGSIIEHSAGAARLVFADPGSLAGQLGFVSDRRDDRVSSVSFDLRLEDVTTVTPGAGGEPAERARVSFAGVSMPTARGEAARDGKESVRELLERARGSAAPGSPLEDDIGRASRQLRERVETLRREVRSKIHERFAFTVASGLMVLIGAVMALRLRDALPLPVYLWSFLPALAAVITISSGQTMVYRFGAAGLLVLWGGVAALAIFTWRQYTLLARH